METKDYLQDIREIKNLMSQSTQFISLSGLSGVMAGIYALIGSVLVNQILSEIPISNLTPANSALQKIILVAAAVLILSVSTAYVMTVSKSKKIGEPIWNAAAQRLLINFCIPLASGGIFALLVLYQNIYGLMVPIMMIFYGLACVNASKYTLRDVRYLGLTMVALGLISVLFPPYGLYFWALGFGFCHILYGAVMHFKYDSH